jgi:hypothetical protein
MNFQVQQKMPTHTSSSREEGLIHAVTGLHIEAAQLALDSVARTQVPRMTVCDRRCGVEDGVVHPLSAFVASKSSHRQKKSFCYLVALASSTGALRRDVFIERHLSRIFPAYPRSLASVLIPRPAALAVLLRCAPFGFRLSESLFGKSPHRTRTKRFSEPSEKARLRPWERGTLASLRA